MIKFTTFDFLILLEESKILIVDMKTEAMHLFILCELNLGPYFVLS